MKKYSKMFSILYMAGFAAGIVCTNLLFEKTGYQSSLLSIYLADAVQKETEKAGLFGELLVRRGVFFGFGTICGLTVVGVPLVAMSLIWFGFLAGSLMTTFLLEYGIRGIFLGIISFVPQMFFYVPGWLIFFFSVIQMSQKFWGNRKRESADYRAYFFFLSLAAVCLLLGIWQESYVNQNLLNYIWKKWV